MSDIVQNDSTIERNRYGRWLVLAFYVTVILLIVTGLSIKVSKDLFESVSFGFLVGVSASGFLILSSLKWFIISVDANGAYVTVDRRASLFKSNDVFVTYGPGLHLSYPWEKRTKDNNVAIEAAAQEFSFLAQVADDVVVVEGSFRLRPSIQLAMTFIRNVASIASEIIDLIASSVSIRLVNKKTATVSRLVKSLNEELHQEFSDNTTVTRFESVFGIIVDDVTIARILSSEEYRKSLTGKAESVVVADAAAYIVGYKTAPEARSAIQRGELKQADFTNALDRVMAIGENIKMNLETKEFKISGLEGIRPDVAEAITAAAAALTNNKGTKK